MLRAAPGDLKGLFLNTIHFVSTDEPQPSRTPQRARLRHSLLRLLLLLLFCTILAPHAAHAQNIEARISLSDTTTPRVRVEGTRREATRVWSFLNIYASATNLAERIENLSLADAEGVEVAARKLAPGEYEAARPATRFSYDFKLNPPEFLSDSAHVSWLTPDRALIMPADLLPIHTGEAKLSLVLPAGWTLASAETRTSDGAYRLADASTAVFFAGKNLTERRMRAGSMEVSLTLAGTWPFDEAEFERTASAILGDYRKMTGGVPRSRALVILTPFPRPAPATNWSAETRGGTVVLLSGVSPSKVAALAQINSTLAHELLHLWVPNGLGLEGEYAWFYEGFTLYQALRLGVRRGDLTFQDYLNALARSYDAYKSVRGGDTHSLVEASTRRWTGAPSLVYQKGLLVAFLYDLTLRQKTNHKKSLDDVYRELFRRRATSRPRADGSATVIDALKSVGEMETFTRLYIENPVAIDLEASIAPFGLRVEAFGTRTRLSVSPNLARRQRDLLRDLGYNEEANAATRRLHESLKKRQHK
ncbi:MAG TPA: hypothetical protein VGV59_10825 [Pyrinomonadaceae bacterium]|nr:hypothetical protein [Pyrinomonadaceae bacterium]